MALVHGAIASLAQGGPFKVTRKAEGAFVDGKYVPSVAAPTIITIDKASVQPLEGEELTDVPEGLRGDEIMLMVTTTRLVAQRRETASDPAVEPDIVTDDVTAAIAILSRENWFVVKVLHYHAFGGYHCEAMLSRRMVP